MEINKTVLVEGLKNYSTVDEDMILLINQFKGSGLIGKLKTAVEIIQRAILFLEQFTADIDSTSQSGNEKRSALIHWLDDIVKLPPIIEWFDDNFFGIVIDAMIAYYNKSFGHSWLEKIKSIM